MAARDAVQQWKPEYQLEKATPSDAMRSRFGVDMVPLSPAHGDRSDTPEGCE